MGLDISAVSKLEPIEVPEDIEQWSDEWYDWEVDQGGDVYNVWSSPNFPEQAEGIENGTYISRDGQHTGFRAGSYSGYGTWRDWLAQATMGGILGKTGGASTMWSSADSGDYGLPFMELINFSDADGIIGPIVSAKLYKDFVDYEKLIVEKIDQWFLKMNPNKEYDSEDMKWFMIKYNDWKKAFKIASNNGAVIFH